MFSQDGRLILARRASNNPKRFTHYLQTTVDNVNNESLLRALLKPVISNDNSTDNAISIHEIFDQLGLQEDPEESYTFYLYQDHNKHWHTPFGHSYSTSNPESHLSFIAIDINRFFIQLQDKCNYRDLLGNYKIILNKYQKTYQEYDPYHYDALRNLSAIIEDEQYLLLSKNKDLRTAYITCQTAKHELYNQYITLVR